MFEASFQYQAIAPIAARHSNHITRCDQPAPVFFAAQQAGKAGIGVKPRPTKPVNGTIRPDEGGRFAIADQRIVFNLARHQVCVSRREGFSGLLRRC